MQGATASLNLDMWEGCHKILGQMLNQLQMEGKMEGQQKNVFSFFVSAVLL
jgi:hypothetical protein